MKEIIKSDQYDSLLLGIKELISNAKSKIAFTVNNTMVLTNWYIGQYIVEYEQDGNVRAEYGTALLKKIAEDLTNEFGRGFSWRNLYNMKDFYLQFPILQTLSAKSNDPKLQTGSAKLDDRIIESIPKLSWSHFVRLLSVKSKEEQSFYLIEAAENNWTERELNRQINAAVFERLVLTKGDKSAKELSEKGQQVQTGIDVLKDPLVLEFLNLRSSLSFTENDLETAIINHLSEFLLELGKGFSFVARQQKISSSTEHFFIDLVFYNRLLKSFVLIDLKIGKLKHQDIGQMQMYVNYYDREVKTGEENPTIGIILCKEKDSFVVEYTLPKENKQIFANEYQLYLPDKKELKQLLENYL